MKRKLKKRATRPYATNARYLFVYWQFRKELSLIFILKDFHYETHQVIRFVKNLCVTFSKRQLLSCMSYACLGSHLFLYLPKFIKIGPRV